MSAMPENLSRHQLKELSRIEISERVEHTMQAGEISIGQAIQVLRQNVAQLTQAEYAKLCGVSQRTLAAVESNQANPSIDTLNQLLKLFGLKLGLSRLHPVR